MLEGGDFDDSWWVHLWHAVQVENGQVDPLSARRDRSITGVLETGWKDTPRCEQSQLDAGLSAAVKRSFGPRLHIRRFNQLEEDARSSRWHEPRDIPCPR